MENMKRKSIRKKILAAAVAAIALTEPSTGAASYARQDTPPPKAFVGSLYYDVKDRYVAAVALAPVGALSIRGKRVLDVSALAGWRNGDSAPVAGFEVGRSWQMFDQVSFHTGIAIVQVQGGRPSGGVVIGIAYRF